MKAWAGAALVAAVLVTVLTFPTVPRMGSVLRIDNNDGKFSVWNIAWVARALVTNPTGVLNANIFYPHTGTLAYSELNLVAGAMAVPAYVATRNPIAATNFAIAAALWLSFMCMWALVRRLTNSWSAGLLSATAYTFCPYLLSHTSHIQLLMAFVIPLNFLALHRLIERPSTARGLQLGGAVALGGLACGYYGIYGGIAMGVAALWFGVRDRVYWRSLVLAVVTAAVIVGPVLYKFREARADVGGGPKISDADLRNWSSKPIDYTVSGARAHEPFQPVFPGRDPLFPGVIALGFALVAVGAALRGRSLSASSYVIAGYGVIVVVAVLASFGPDAWVYSALRRLVPGMDLLRAPSRFGLVAAFGVAVLAGIGTSLIRRRVWIVLVLTLVAAAETGAQTEKWGWPSWGLTEMPSVPRAYRVLATLPRGPVVEYPFPYKSTDLHNHGWAMLMSTYHWQPLVNGYSDVIPSDMYDIMLPINGFPDVESFAIMRNRQVRYVVWDIRTYDAASRDVLEHRFPPFAQYLKPLVKDDDVWLYEITGYPQ